MGIGRAVTHHTAQANPLRARRAAGVFKAKCALPFGATIEHLPPLPRELEFACGTQLQGAQLQGAQVRGAYTVRVQCTCRARAVHAYAVHVHACACMCMHTSRASCWRSRHPRRRRPSHLQPPCRLPRPWRRRHLRALRRPDWRRHRRRRVVLPWSPWPSPPPPPRAPPTSPRRRAKPASPRARPLPLRASSGPASAAAARAPVPCCAQRPPSRPTSAASPRALPPCAPPPLALAWP
eukprot:scaffold54500_cov65-Phaeocystis_antarctica.AAC.2